MWKVKNSNTACYTLDENHGFYVERTDNGFILRLYDNRGRDYKPDKPIILYSRELTDSQIGFKIDEG